MRDGETFSEHAEGFAVANIGMRSVQARVPAVKRSARFRKGFDVNGIEKENRLLATLLTPDTRGFSPTIRLGPDGETFSEGDLVAKGFDVRVVFLRRILPARR